MENTYKFEVYTINLNKYCSVYVNGLVHYTPTWVDGTTNTHYGKINCRMELQDVKLDYIEIASYEMMAKTGDGINDWTTVAEVNCHNAGYGDYANGGTQELMEWLEKKLNDDGAFEGDVMVHAEEQGAPDPVEHGD